MNNFWDFLELLVIALVCMSPFIFILLLAMVI